MDWRILALPMCLVPLVTWSRDIPVGDWTWNIDDPELLTAATLNKTGQALAQFCVPTTGSCLYLITLGINCEKGEPYAALVNSDLGTATMDLLCHEEVEKGGEHTLVFTDFDQIDKIIRGAQRVGFAIAMEEGEFKAVRFSLDGSNKAIDLMREAALRIGSAESSTKKAKDEQTF